MRKIVSIIRSLAKFIRISQSIKFGSLWNLIHGFSKKTIHLNGITKENYKSFMSDRQYRLGHPYNGPYSSIIDNKLYLPFLLKDYPEHAPQYFYYLNNQIYCMSDAKFGVASFQDFIGLLQEKGKLVLKHTSSSLGQGFHLVEVGLSDDINLHRGGYMLDKQMINKDNLFKFIYSLKDYVVSEYVQQHNYAYEINSSSLNTIRMLCVWDDDINGFYIARCFHRFGSNGSLVDNLGGGNACLHFVDIETGKLEAAGMTNNNNLGEHYSDSVIHASGKNLAGLQIPKFDEVKCKVIEISNSLPFLRYVGWDIAITEDGFKIIEANSLTSLGILQRKGGYLEDSRLRKIFRIK